MWKKDRGRKGRGIALLTCIDVDGDNNIHHHCLDDIASPQTCQVIVIRSLSYTLISHGTNREKGSHAGAHLEE
jgi:hypothetical protein